MKTQLLYLLVLFDFFSIACPQTVYDQKVAAEKQTISKEEFLRQFEDCIDRDDLGAGQELVINYEQSLGIVLTGEEREEYCEDPNEAFCAMHRERLEANFHRIILIRQNNGTLWLYVDSAYYEARKEIWNMKDMKKRCEIFGIKPKKNPPQASSSNGKSLSRCKYFLPS